MQKIAPYIAILTTVILLLTACRLTSTFEPDPALFQKDEPAPPKDATPPAQKYSVTYHANGASSGNPPPTQSNINGSSITLAGNPGALAKTGFTFIGWNTKADQSGIYYTTGATYIIAENSSLYAHWRWSQASQMTSANGFGISTDLSADGRIAIAGSPKDNPRGTDSGSAYIYIFEGTSWKEQAKLIPGDAAPGDSLGMSVSLSSDGQVALVGAGYDDDKGDASGSAYVYSYNGSKWSQQAKLLATDGKAKDHFGTSVSLSSNGRIALISATSGSAYIYSYNGSKWSQQAKLLPKDADDESLFGYSVSLSADGRVALIGVPLDDEKETHSGSAYVYHYDGGKWSQQAKLTAPDAAISDWFGISVSLSADGQVALVGVPNDDDKGRESGSAYVYMFDGTKWTEQAKLLAADAVTGDSFGTSISLSPDGRIALIGATHQDDKGFSAGAAYMYRYNGTSWTQEPKLTAADGAAENNFGRSVSLSTNGASALIGANKNADSIYFFR